MYPIAKLLESVKDLPTSPQVLPKLMEILQDVNSDVEEAGDLISFDPALTARLLRYCNSAYFAGADPVASVTDAIGRVGFNSISTLMTAACSKDTFNMPVDCGLDSAVLWKHSVLTAFGARFVAEATGGDSNMLFTAGILHDAGRVVLAKKYSSQYGQLMAQARHQSVQASLLESDAYGFTHAEVSATMLRNWRFPSLLAKCVHYHHRPSEAGDAQREAAAVCLGDVLAHSADQPLPSYIISEKELGQAMALLGLTSDDMADYGVRMKQNWDLVNSLVRG